MKKKVYTKTIKNGIVLRTDKDPLVEYASLFKKERLACYGLMIMGGIFGFLGLIFSVSMFASGEIYDEDQLLMFIPFILVPAGFILFAIYNLKKPQRVKQAWLEFCREMEDKDNAFLRNHPHYDGEQLYEKCKKNKVDIETTEGKARLTLIANKLEIEGTIDELIEKYNNGKAFIEKEKAAEKAAKEKEKIAKAKAEEKEIVKKAKRYIDLRNQEKRIYIANEVIRELNIQKDALENASRDAMNLSGKMTYQKEGDWALMGGIASGLAGPVAGIATAVDTQIKNASIRESNDNLRTLAARAGAYRAMEIAGQILEIKEELKKWEKIKSEANLKLVGEIDEKTLLKKLSPTVEKKKKSISGNYLLKIKTPAATVKIFDTVDAVIDGTFKANLIANGEIVGSAYVTLPYNGSQEAQTLETICLTNSKAQSINVVFEPYNLFAIEKI